MSMFICNICVWLSLTRPSFLSLCVYSIHTPYIGQSVYSAIYLVTEKSLNEIVMLLVHAKEFCRMEDTHW